MKRLLVFSLAAALFACNSSDNKSAEEVKTGDTKVASMSVTDLPYQVKEWGDWQPGNMENAKMAMQCLKDFQEGNVGASMKYFADSIELRFDDLSGKFTKDSAQKMFEEHRKQIKAIDIQMDDFESVKSKDGKQEYVSLWYKQKWQDQKGNWDSVICMDDMKIVDGKIATLDEKTRRFPKKKM
jgi:hypothetical protein